MLWNESAFDDEDSAVAAIPFPPHPLPMAYAPPNRLTVPLPSLVPPAANPLHRRSVAARPSPQPPSSAGRTSKTRPSYPIKKKTQRTVPHETIVNVTMETPLAWFATNIPRPGLSLAGGGGGGAVAGSHSTGTALATGSASPRIAPFARSAVTSHDVFFGDLKGWLEPHPDAISTQAEAHQGLGGAGGGDFIALGNGVDTHGIPRPARRVAPRSVLLLSSAVLQHCFLFLDAGCLDSVVVHTCIRFYQVVTESLPLRQRRFEFCVPHRSVMPPRSKSTGEEQAKDTPWWGIMRYLATRRARAPGLTIFGTSSSQGSGGGGDARLYNPCFHTEPLVRVVCVTAPSTTSSNQPTLPATSTSSPRVHRAASSSSIGVPKEHLLSWGPSAFVTPNVPYAWVGVELLGNFSVTVSGYGFCISTGRQSALPLSWELQGCTARSLTLHTRDEDQDWKCCEWHVLHKYDASSAMKHALAATQYKGKEEGRSSTTTAKPGSPIDRFLLEVPSSRWGPMRRLRIVQTSRNSLWGHELPISGLEIFGQLHKSEAFK